MFGVIESLGIALGWAEVIFMSVLWLFRATSAAVKDAQDEVKPHLLHFVKLACAGGHVSSVAATALFSSALGASCRTRTTLAFIVIVPSLILILGFVVIHILVLVLCRSRLRLGNRGAGHVAAPGVSARCSAIALSRRTTGTTRTRMAAIDSQPAC